MNMSEQSGSESPPSSQHIAGLVSQFFTTPTWRGFDLNLLDRHDDDLCSVCACMCRRCATVCAWGGRRRVDDGRVGRSSESSRARKSCGDAELQDA